MYKPNEIILETDMTPTNTAEQEDAKSRGNLTDRAFQTFTSYRYTHDFQKMFLPSSRLNATILSVIGSFVGSNTKVENNTHVLIA